MKRKVAAQYSSHSEARSAKAPDEKEHLHFDIER
jgi:hypothetical protein